MRPIVMGDRVRHSKRPAWGIGTVVTAASTGDRVELDVQFEDAQRKLKLRVADLDALLEFLPDEELAALDAVAEAAQAAREVTARKAAADRARSLRATPLPFRTCIAMRSQAIANAGDGVMVAGGDALRVFDATGNPIEQIAYPKLDRWSPHSLLGNGNGLFVAPTTDHVCRGEMLIARRGVPHALRWRPTTTFDGEVRVVLVSDLVIIHDDEHIAIALEDGSEARVPLELGGRTISTLTPWGSDLLVGTASRERDASDYFRYLRLGLDGAVKHEGIGAFPVPIDDRRLATFEGLRLVARDRSGQVVGTIEGVIGPNIITGRLIPYARLDDDLVLVRVAGDGDLVRWSVDADELRWSTRIFEEPTALQFPVRVGARIAVTGLRTSREPPKVVLVDGATGEVCHVFDVREPVDELIPVGDDALVAFRIGARRLDVWTNLASAPVHRVLEHESECFGAVSPARGLVVTHETDAVRFFAL